MLGKVSLVLTVLLLFHSLASSSAWCVKYAVLLLPFKQLFLELATRLAKSPKKWKYYLIVQNVLAYVGLVFCTRNAFYQKEIHKHYTFRRRKVRRSQRMPSPPLSAHTMNKFETEMLNLYHTTPIDSNLNSWTFNTLAKIIIKILDCELTR